MFREKSCSESHLNFEHAESSASSFRAGIYHTPDARITPPSMNICDTSPMLSKNLKKSYDERLNVSRKLFNLSRNHVEKLKRNHCVKRVKSIIKPTDDAWITSGSMGSRDAVLVFRTRPTTVSSADEDNNLESEKNSEPAVSQPSGGMSTSVYNCDKTKRSDESNILHPKNVMTTSLPSTSSNSKKTFNEEADEIKAKDSHINKSVNNLNVHISHLNRGRNSPTHNHKVHVNVRKLGRLQKKRLNSEFLRDSMSSSDNSISSECDDPYEMEEAIRKTLSEADDLDVSEPQERDHDPDDDDDDDKENIEAEDEDEDENCTHVPNMPAAQLKITYKFLSTETKLLRKIFHLHGLSEVEGEENFSILWTGIHMKPDILRNLAPYQRVNHFPRSYELTRKDRLYKNIERMQHLRGFKHFDIVPQSFILPLEYRDLVSAHNKNRGPWIVKPAASSRGRGIFIVNSPDQIPNEEQVLVSKYVADPLCIDGHKCDLRVYVLVTSFDPLIIYLYEEGLVRLATVKYDRNADNLWNPCMHLCNYSINKYHSDYIKSSDIHDEDVGHKWTLSALLRHLKSQKCDTRQLMCSIEDLIIKSILACAQSIISACRMFVPSGNNCFELYGFDILIDDTLKPWLLEINLSPSMGVDSPLDNKVKSCLMTDLLTCIGIPAYSPKMRGHYDSKWTRFRGVNYPRRTNSADPISNSQMMAKRVGPFLPATTMALTVEEQRIIRNARLQNARRGCFVRIFPTEDTMQRYGTFLDPATGIPLSTPVAQGQVSYSMILPHNYNQMLFNNLYGKSAKDSSVAGNKEENSCDERMSQYERALGSKLPLSFAKKKIEPKCVEEGKRLRKQILKLIDNGSELTQLQARQTFSLYLEAILRRLTQEPRDYHEKLILKFVNKVGGTIRAPVFFRNPQNFRIVSKARSAMVAKLLGDFLEQYNRDTEAYVDSFDHYGMIPTSLFNEFLSQAQEADLESVLAIHTSLTGTMPYLYNRCGLSVPPTPPIPSGVHGFLKALPAMVVSGSGARDINNLFKMTEKEHFNLRSEATPKIGGSNKKKSKRKNSPT